MREPATWSDLIRVAHAAQMAGITREYAYRLIRRGILPVTVIDGVRFTSRKQTRQWIRLHRPLPKS